MKVTSNICRAAMLLIACLCQQALTPARAATPPGCQGCGVAVAPLTAATIVKTGTTVLFDVSVANAIPGACDIVNATVTFYCPDINGAPDLAHPHVLTTTLSLPFGSNATVATGIPCLISTTSSQLAQASATVSGAPGSCLKSSIDQASGSGTTTLAVSHPCLQVTKNCPANCTPYGQPITFTGNVINCGDEDIDVTLSDNPAATITPSGTFTVAAGATVPYSGTYTPTANLCGPLNDTITANGVSVLTGTTEAPTASASCPVCNNPCVGVTKDCSSATAIVNGSYTVNGTVSNCGNVPLVNVHVIDTITFTPTTGGPTTTTVDVLANGTLALGQTMQLTATINNIPANFCGTITDQFSVTADSLCPGAAGAVVHATGNPATSAVCTQTIVSHPGITITKTCGPASIVLGTPYTVSGTVNNTGDRPLNNIVVTESLTDANNVTTTTTINIAGPVPAGGSAPIPPQTITPVLCGPSTDHFSVTAVDTCGQQTSNTSNTCVTQVTSTPGITVTKVCGPANIVLGNSYTVSGSVQNTGNTVLHNIVVTDTITDANNNITTVSIPIAGTLNPGASAPIPTQTITPEVCGPSKDQFSVTAVDACGTATPPASSQTCTTQVGSTPSITVTKVCGPASIILGSSYTVSGTVQNTGNTTLHNIVVTDTITDANNVVTTVTIPIAVTLDPGATTPILSQTITPILCGPSKDQFSVTAVDSCGTATPPASSQTCTTQVTSNPGITVTKVCGPTGVILGNPYTVSGSVQNTGNTALHNIVVIDTITDANNVATTVTIPIVGTLNPGDSAQIPSQTITPTLCGPSKDQFSVTAVDACGTATPPASSQTCTTQVTSTPGITVTKVCGPASIVLGSPYTVSGSVQNTGNTALHNIVVTDTITDANNHSTTVTIPIVGTLNPGDSAQIPSQTITPTLCGPSSDQFSVTAVDACGTATPPALSQTCTTQVTSTPGITVTKVCGPASVVQGHTYTVSGSVQNTGDTTLHNIVVTDTITDAANHTTTVNITIPGTLNVGASASIPTQTISPTLCGPSKDQFSVTAVDACGKPTPAASSQTCTTTVLCPPCITVVKEIACAPASGICDGNLNYHKTATGVAGTTDPAFCYRITVTNPAGSPGFETCTDSLQNIVVNDPQLGGDLPGFKTTLAPGESTVAFFKKTWGVSGSPHVNTVTASGVGVQSGQSVSVPDHATAIVQKLGVACELTLFNSFDEDGNANDNHVTLPSDAGPNTPVVVGITLSNTGTADLLVTSITGLENLVDCDTGAAVVLADILGGAFPLSIGAGNSISIPGPGATPAGAGIGCWNVTCPGGTLSVNVAAVADSGPENTVCIYDSNGNPVSTSSSCSATVVCAIPASCRVTGGGVLLPGEVEQNTCSPDITTTIQGPNCSAVDAVKVTHGGQLGAPYGRVTCGNVAQFPQGDPCIRGQWEHVRHYKGKGNPKSDFSVDNFHSNNPKGIFDSLQCACLPCCENPDAGGKQGKLCNPDDHKICGPMPRPAPANAIIFSGVGYIKSCASANKKGGRTDAVLFRVYIEDRSEPGGQHPGGGKKPADIYCFQAWSLADITGNASGKIDSADAIAARQALADDNCAFIKAYTQGSLPNANVLGTPLVNDCGAVHTGNQQIHPSTGATCNQ